MKKNKAILRFYLAPILSTITAIVFWSVFREQKTYYWWLALIAFIALVHYWVYWRQERMHG